MIRFRSSQARATARQRGAILVVTLMFLIIITMLAITSVQVSSSEERQAGNLKDWNIAMQAAETALRDAEFDLNSNCAVNITTCTVRNPAISGQTNFGNQAAGIAPDSCNQSTSYKGACLPPNAYQYSGDSGFYFPLNSQVWQTGTATNSANVVTYGTYTGALALPTTGISAVYQQPQYMIEAMRMPTNKSASEVLYRVTSHGWGRSQNTMVVLQTVWRMPP